MNNLNELLITAYSTRGAVIDNLIAIATWWTSLLWRTSHFEKVSLDHFDVHFLFTWASPLYAVKSDAAIGRKEDLVADSEV